MPDEPSPVSVIVPAYNRKQYIKECVNSVLNQDYPNVELIVVDDGSTDGTFEILKAYADAGKLILLSHENRQNKGQSAAINLGLKSAKGEYIAILDSDDLFAKNKLSLQVAYLQAHLDVSQVYGNWVVIDGNGNSLHTHFSENHVEKSDPNKLLLDCYLGSPGILLTRKSVFDAVGFFDEGFRAAQDHDMALRIMEKFKVAYIPEIAFYYRKHGDTISANGLERRWKNGFEILERAKRRYLYKKTTLRKRRAVLNFRLGQTYWSQNKHLKGLPYLVKSMVYDPMRALSVVLGREKIN